MLTIADGRLAFRATKQAGARKNESGAPGNASSVEGVFRGALKPDDFCATSVMIAGAWLGRVSHSIEECLGVG